eukprot:10106985-Lingulodinium_polyedra.AAC.1
MITDCSSSVACSCAQVCECNNYHAASSALRTRTLDRRVSTSAIKLANRSRARYVSTSTRAIRKRSFCA